MSETEGKVRLTKRDRTALMPFATMLVSWTAQIEAMSHPDLRALRRACGRPTSTNCWWAIFEAAEVLQPQIETELHRRKLLKRRARPAGRQALSVPEREGGADG